MSKVIGKIPKEIEKEVYSHWNNYNFPRLGLVVYDFESMEEQSISVFAGEFVIVEKELDKGWCYGRIIFENEQQEQDGKNEQNEQQEQDGKNEQNEQQEQDGKNEQNEQQEEHKQARRLFGLMPLDNLVYIRVDADDPSVYHENPYELFYRSMELKCNCCNETFRASEKVWYHADNQGDKWEMNNLCEECHQKLSRLEIENLFPDQFLDNTGKLLRMNKHPGELFHCVLAGKVVQSLHNAFLAYADRPCFGIRQLDSKGNLEEKFSWTSYGEIHQRVCSFGKGLKYLGTGISESQLFVGICGVNSIDWFVSELAAMSYGFVSVPLMTTKVLLTDTADILHMLSNSNISILITEKKYTNRFLNLSKKAPNVKVIIQMEEFEDLNLEKQAQEMGIQLLSMSNVEELGQNYNYNLYVRPKDELLNIVYTSGSTGSPKGAMIPERVLYHEICRPQWRNHPFVIVSFAPLCHAVDRINSYSAILSGGRVGIYSGDIQLIYDDIRILSPFVISASPRFYNRIFSEYQRDISLLKFKGETPDKKDLLEKYKLILGKRIKALITGGAPISDDVVQFIKECFQCLVYNGYASTECGAINFHPNADHGQSRLFDGVEWKLIDCPELDYYVKSTPSQGEVCIKSPTMFSGYFRDAEATKRSFTDDGFFKTGDIGEITKDNGFVIIDRKKNIFKLSQGEYLAPEFLENTFIKSPFVDQIYIYGDSYRTSILSVVVPKFDVVAEFCLQMNLFLPSDLEEKKMKIISESSLLKEEILKSFHEIGVEASLKPYEIPIATLVDTTPWTQENLRMTGSGKLCRPQLRKYYQEQLNNLYHSVEQRSQDEMLLTAIKNELKIDIIQGDKTFSELGGDSLKAARINNILQSTFNLRIDTTMMMKDNITISELKKYIRERKEIVIEEEIRLDDRYDATNLTLDTNKPYTSVLLTGSTGFLGIHLLDQLLQSLPKSVVYCIVRGKSKAHALERMKNTIIDARLDIDLNRVKIVLGDLSSERLSLSTEKWKFLSETIDVVYHNGAVVGFYEYHDIKGVNVDSTLELLDFCQTHHLKPLHFVSTIGVYGLVQHKTSELIVPSNHFHSIGGYNQSKWVCEQLLLQASKRGFVVIIFRPSLICPNSKTGYSNAKDWFTAFIQGSLAAELAPTSESRLSAIPADFASKFIVFCTTQALDLALKCQIFNMINLHSIEFGGAPTLSQIFERMKSIKNEIQLLPYPEWINKLNELKEEKKDNPIFRFWNVYNQSDFPSMETMHVNIPNSNTRKLSEMGNIECPRLLEVLPKMMNRLQQK